MRCVMTLFADINEDGDTHSQRLHICKLLALEPTSQCFSISKSDSSNVNTILWLANPPPSRDLGNQVVFLNVHKTAIQNSAIF